VRQAPERAARRVGDGLHGAGETAAHRKHAALHVDRVRAGSRRERRALAGIVHDAPRRAEHAGPRSRQEKRLARPQRRAALVHDLAYRHERARLEVAAERAGEPERDEPSVRERRGRAEPDADDPRRRPPRRTLLGGEGADENQFIVQARLRAVSRRLSLVASVAAGSNPEWIAQWSQRWSFPGP
jgi:hypothetical protein